MPNASKRAAQMVFMPSPISALLLAVATLLSDSHLLVAAAPAPAPQLISNKHQCGGKGFGCTGGNCQDAPWLGYACDAGLVCLRDSEQWWHCGRHTELGGSPGIDLLWADEFEGSSLNTSNWNLELGDGSAYSDISGGWGGWGSDEQQCYTSSPTNIMLADGLLTISAKHQPDTPCVNYNVYTNVSYETSRASWSSAKITSANKKSFMWFPDGSPVYVEARVRPPAAPAGRSPGFWFLASLPSPYGRWPSSGEIDVGRHTHSHVGQGGEGEGSLLHSDPSGGVAADGPFQVWAVEWAPTYIAWILDGHEVHRSPSSEWHSAAAPDEPGAPFDQPFYAILDLAIDGAAACPPGAACAPPDLAAAHFSIDYVRAWRVAKPSAAGLAAATAAVAPKAPSRAIGLTEQCGGLAGRCHQAASGGAVAAAAAAASCRDGPWPGSQCAPGLQCMRSSDAYWGCGSPSATPPELAVSSTTTLTTGGSPCSKLPLLLAAFDEVLEQQFRALAAGSSVKVTSSSGCQALGRQLSASQVTITATASVAAWISPSQLRAVAAAVAAALNSPTSPLTAGPFADAFQVLSAASTLAAPPPPRRHAAGARRFKVPSFSSLYGSGSELVSGPSTGLVGLALGCVAAVVCLAGLVAWAAAQRKRDGSHPAATSPRRLGCCEQGLKPGAAMHSGDSLQACASYPPPALSPSARKQQQQQQQHLLPHFSTPAPQ